tara:strand:+ start:322 stop:465 length:144 start_codon:yes stop_codon:yes gene_type:complete
MVEIKLEYTQVAKKEMKPKKNTCYQPKERREERTNDLLARNLEEALF